MIAGISPQAPVLVVGAGPAGATAARALALARVPVRLLDRSVFPRNKPCGGGISVRALRRFPYLERELHRIATHAVARLYLEGPDGEDVAAPAYVQLLARTYDLMKAADPKVFIDGGSVSPRGIDRPETGRDTHSPTAFITDMGTAYRAMKRKRPIMDGFSFHPYGENSSTPPTITHTSGTSLGLADYPRLVYLLGQAFNGTAQLGSKLPIVYDEYGVDSQIPETKRSFYGGKEPATTRPVSEGVQAAYYDEALRMAACQPTVRGFLIFHVTDETDYNRWQSGVYYADGTPKTSRALVKRAIGDIHAGAYECGEPPFTTDTFGWVLVSASG